jgi:hypothetical protein
MRILLTKHERPPQYYVITLQGSEGFDECYYDGSVFAMNPQRAVRFTDPAAAARFAEHLRYDQPRRAGRIDVSLPPVFKLRGPCAAERLAA